MSARFDRRLALRCLALCIGVAAACASGAVEQTPRERHAGESPTSMPRSRSVAVRAARLHTLAGPPIEDGVVWIEDGRIRAIGAASEIELPEGIAVVEAAVATPGLVDARSCLGLAGSLNAKHDREEVDPNAPIQPELSALDAYDAREPLIEWVRSFGVTTVHTGHAPSALISGGTMVVKLRGDTVAEALLLPDAMIACALGEGARGGTNAPGTSARAAALLRAELVAAREYAERRARPDDAAPGDEGEEPEPLARDLRKEALARVLSGETPLLVHAQTARDLMTALRIAREFEGIRLVLDGAAEAPLVLEELREARVPILLHPTMQRPIGEAQSSSFETARLLREAGLEFALQSGYESYVPRTRCVLFEAAIAARHGLAFEDALASITREPARILGLLERVGTLEVGKDGDVALYDGDPFEYTSHCLGVVIDGIAYPGERELRERRDVR